MRACQNDGQQVVYRIVVDHRGAKALAVKCHGSQVGGNAAAAPHAAATRWRAAIAVDLANGGG